MKITEMKDGSVRDRILNAAQHVMSRTSSVSHLLEEADKFLAHEFADPFTDRAKSSIIIEALNRGNGCVYIALYVEPGGVISGHQTTNEFPRSTQTPNYLKVVEVESQAYQQALANMKGKTYTKRTIVKWFLEYTPDMVY